MLFVTGATRYRRASRNFRSIPTSPAMPLPPNVVIATSAASQAASEASSFAMFASAPHGFPASNSEAACQRSSAAVQHAPPDGKLAPRVGADGPPKAHPLARVGADRSTNQRASPRLSE